VKRSKVVLDIIGVLLLVAVVVDFSLPDDLRWGWTLPLIFLAAVGVSIVGAFNWFRDRPEAWECKRCRYDLRGASGDTCPECGARR